MNLAANVTNSSNSRRPDSNEETIINYKEPSARDLKGNKMKLTVGVDLFDELVEDLFVEGLTHESEDVGNHVGGNAAALVPVKTVEGLAQHC